MSSLWEERAARNEALFRDVNEQVRAISSDFDPETYTVDFVCECSNDTCVERLSVSVAVYERVRADSRQFILKPGHQTEIERVVGRADGVVIVEKEGTAGRIADQTNPRA
jgi:hypothetical protein